MKPLSKILPLLFLLSLALLPISCENDEDNYTGPWHEVPTPGGIGQLNSCYFNSPDDGWACGHDGTGEGKMIFIHWDGVEWKEHEYPGWFDAYGTVKKMDISDVFFTSPDDGWAVGFVRLDNDDFFGFVLRYDGNDWYLFEKDVTFYEIYGISENDVWFIGNSSYDSDLYHWNGTEFEYYNLNPGNCGLDAIAFGSANDGLAVGYYKYVYHWDGVSWDLINYDYGGELSCVAYDTPSTAFIGGDELRRWENGELTWYLDYTGTYNGLHFSHPDEGWMYGGEPVEGIPQGEGFIWHWDGAVWTRASRPYFMFPWDIFSIDYNDAWAVGIDDHGNCGSWMYVPQ